MTTGNEELDKKLDLLMDKLKGIIQMSSENKLYPVVLTGKGPHFYWSINDKMFLEVPAQSELYVMADKGMKEDKLYVWRCKNNIKHHAVSV